MDEQGKGGDGVRGPAEWIAKMLVLTHAVLGCDGRPNIGENFPGYYSRLVEGGKIEGRDRGLALASSPLTMLCDSGSSGMACCWRIEVFGPHASLASVPI
jgi:hypothetical protein